MLHVVFIIFELDCILYDNHLISISFLSQSLKSPFKYIGFDDSMSHVEARYPAILFKQQLTACVEKIFGLIRDNLKKEISPLLGSCIQVGVLSWFLSSIFLAGLMLDRTLLFNNNWGYHQFSSCVIFSSFFLKLLTVVQIIKYMDYLINE